MSVAVRPPERRDRISTLFAHFAILPALTPLVVVAAIIPLGQARAANPAGLPLAFALTGAALSLFAVGYLAMSRHIPNAGNLYAYVAHGLGRPAGLGAAWLSLVTYGLLQLSLYGLIGVASSEVATRLFGTDVSWWMAALVSWLAVALIALVPTQVKGGIAVAVGVVGLAIVVTIVLTLALGPSGALRATGPGLLEPATLAASGTLLLPAVFAFAGIESAARFTTVGRLPRRVVAWLTYGSGLVGGALFTVAAWGIVAHPSIVDTQSAFQLLESRLPRPIVAIGALALLAAVLAAIASWQDMLVRLTRSLWLERVSPGTLPLPRPPLRSVAVVSAPGLAVLVLIAALRLDPVSWLLAGAGMAGAYGLLLALLLASVAVTMFFARNHRQVTMPRRLLAPVAASILLAGAAALSAVHLDALVKTDVAIGWVVAVAVPFVAVAGALAARVVRGRHPHRFEAIGLGANAITGNAEADHIAAPPYVATHSALTSH